MPALKLQDKQFVCFSKGKSEQSKLKKCDANKMGGDDRALGLRRQSAVAVARLNAGETPAVRMAGRI